MMRRLILLGLVALLLAGCAGMALREPLRVSLAGVGPLPSEGMEARFVLKLRVQNPNSNGVDFNGVSVNLDVDGKSFGSGVSDQRGSLPAYGEQLIEVPVTVPATAILRQVFSISAVNPPSSFQYRLRGRLGGIGPRGVTFESQGELALPEAPRRGE
ncbi:MAG: LEA type 2 family protein [Gammaproteobacteria bacterium]